MGRLALAVALGGAATAPAAAMEFVVRPPLIFAVGTIRHGDQHAFDEILKAQAKGTIRIVVLHSGGGLVRVAGDLGRSIRARRLSTLVDAGRGRCASACTIVFAGGVERIYLGASTITDGTTRRATHGLGFHEGSSPTSRDADHYSGAGTGQALAYYYEFGVPKAAELATRARPDELYVISAATAAALGIATRLGSSDAAEGAPKPPRMRP